MLQYKLELTFVSVKKESTTIVLIYKNNRLTKDNKKGKVIPLQVRCGPEGRYRYSSTLP